MLALNHDDDPAEARARTARHLCNAALGSLSDAAERAAENVAATAVLVPLLLSPVRRPRHRAVDREGDDITNIVPTIQNIRLHLFDSRSGVALGRLGIALQALDGTYFELVTAERLASQRSDDELDRYLHQARTLTWSWS